MFPEDKNLEAAAEQLCATARWCAARGWVPATSGNFSVRDGERMLVTASGLDKGALTRAGLLEIDATGKVMAGEGTPSAETALHRVLYRKRPQAKAILHVHTIWNTLVSGRFEAAGRVTLYGYELEKAFAGVGSHESSVQVPVLMNSQDYVWLAEELERKLDEYPDAPGVLLSRHGLYTWGDSVAEARRHLEALEFLFEVEERRQAGGSF
jgi:methylthioribulose-1-phosphate dehydratase